MLCGITKKTQHNTSSYNEKPPYKLKENMDLKQNSKKKNNGFAGRAAKYLEAIKYFALVILVACIL